MKMIKSCLFVIGILLLVLAGSITQSQAMADRVSVGGNLPSVRFDDPPFVVVIPGTYVYMVPDIDVDVFFYQDYWWRSHEGHWYRSRDYNGSWGYIESVRLPRGLRELPQDYRHRLSPEYKRMHHNEVKKNWKRWEKERYWDRRNDNDRGGRHDNGRH